MRKKITGYPAWLGLSEDRTSFIYLPDRAEIVREIFKECIAGLGGYTIANRLNAKNVRAFGPSPRWDQSTIHNLLRNRATIGEYQPKRYHNGRRTSEGDPVPGYYPAVIDEDLFQAAQVARQDHLASGRGRKGSLITNLFRGLLTCAYCASPVKFKSKSNIKSVICTKVIGRQGCYRIAWSYKDFENSVLEVVKNHATGPTVTPSRETLAELVVQVREKSGHALYEARLGLAAALKVTVIELKVASGGPKPVPSAQNARIRLDRPGRYFEIQYRDGAIHIGAAVVSSPV